MQAIVFTPASVPSTMPSFGNAPMSLNPFTLSMAQDAPFSGMEQGGTVEMARRRRRRRYR